MVKGIKHRMLTAKQEKFVEELIKGKSQREAYKSAYDTSNMKDKSIDENACKLMKNTKIASRYKELTKPKEDEATAMRRFIIENLQKIASGEICDETTEYDAEGSVIRQKRTIKASDRRDALNKLAEYYNVTPDVSVQHEVNVTFVDSLKEYCD